MTNTITPFDPKRPRALPLVYAAGPYTNPDPVENTHQAIKEAARLTATGLMVAYAPHMTMIAHAIQPAPLDHWYDFDLHIMSRFDAIYRLPGASTGADGETEVAREIGIPVFLVEDDLMWWARGYASGGRRTSRFAE